MISKLKKYLLIAGSGNKLEPGNHVFPFTFTLEDNLPSSFESDHGEVKYSLKVRADIPWGIDQVEKTYFIVHDIYDLNLHPRSRVSKSSDRCYENAAFSVM